jgi:hypothetical protein
MPAFRCGRAPGCPGPRLLDRPSGRFFVLLRTVQNSPERLQTPSIIGGIGILVFLDTDLPRIADLPPLADRIQVSPEG